MSTFTWNVHADIEKERHAAANFELRSAALHAALYGDDPDRLESNVFDKLAIACHNKIALLEEVEAVLEYVERLKTPMLDDLPESSDRVH